MKQNFNIPVRRTLTVLCGAALAAFAVACQKDNNTVELTAVMADRPDSGAKVYIDGLRACWQQGDAVKIYSGGAAADYSLAVTSADGVSATIRGVAQGDSYTAGYPASAATVTGPGTLAIDFPAVQAYERVAIYSDADGAAQRIASPMAAYSTGDILKFYNVGALLKVVVANTYAEAVTLHSVEVESDNAPLAGTAAVSVSAAGTDIVAVSGTSRTVTLSLSDADVTLASSGGSVTLYLPVLPIAESAKSNLTVLVKATGAGGRYTFVSGSADGGVWIARNQMGSVPARLDEAGKTAVNAHFWGQGTEKSPFLIENEADLYTLRNLVTHTHLDSYDDAVYNANTVYYRQTADLDISRQRAWGQAPTHAVGSTARPFRAHYNGDGHSVKLGVTSSKPHHPIGIFGVVGEGASISCLTSTGSVSTTNHVSTGGVVGLVAGNATIDRCDNKAAIRNSGAEMSDKGVGGVCGQVQADGGTVTLSNCSNHGTVSTAGMRAGGIVGHHSAGTLTVDGCANHAAVGQTSYHHTHQGKGCGGIVGHIHSADGTATVQNCTNNGTVSGFQNIGGLIGRTENATVIAGCANTAAVAARTFGRGRHNIGGMVGSATGTLTLQGAVRQQGDVTGMCYVGGVVGHIASTLTVDEDATVEVDATVKYSGSTTCTTHYTSVQSLASVTGGLAGYCNYLAVNGAVAVRGAVTHSGTAYRCVGGIVGVVGDARKSDCHFTVGNRAVITNEAAVDGTHYTGGFVGWAQKMTISDGSGHHVNTGRVTGSVYVGGIAGHIHHTSGLNRCTNRGNIRGDHHVGGLVGRAEAASTFTYCRNSGAVMAGGGSSMSTDAINQSGVAGILASAGGALSFVRCLNSGDVTAVSGGGSSLYVGGISGYTNAAVTMSDCGNTGHLRGSGVAAAGLAAMCHANTSTITNSYNQGNLTYNSSTSTGGGITSAVNSRPTLKNCYFSGTVSIVGKLTNYGNMSGSYNHSNYTAHCTDCYSIDQTAKGTNYAAANHTITRNTDNEYVTSSRTRLRDALNNWQNSNTAYSTWSSSCHTELPRLSWEDE
ncbi:MAG: fibronectin type III domain-containing protein [bacterium P3]|nr:MAG: fibronectin type III domain-containing protein [bacterium P3]KWW42769.1 MAG: fibronectin type III domain-containing protein [bacterium F083]